MMRAGFYANKDKSASMRSTKGKKKRLKKKTTAMGGFKMLDSHQPIIEEDEDDEKVDDSQVNKQKELNLNLPGMIEEPVHSHRSQNTIKNSQRTVSDNTKSSGSGGTNKPLKTESDQRLMTRNQTTIGGDDDMYSDKQDEDN